MTPRRPHAQIHLPPLSADYAITLVDIFERAITAIWNAHGDAMSSLIALRGDRTKSRDIVPSGDPNAPDSDF
jgi:hypothetical protein